MRLFAAVLTLLVTNVASADTILASAGTSIYFVNTATGTATPWLHTSTTWYDIAVAPDGSLFGSDGGFLFRIDPASGSTTRLGYFGHFINGMTFVGNTLYGSGDWNVYTIDLVTGAAQPLGPPAFPSSGDLAQFGGALYLSALCYFCNPAVNSDLLVRIDPLTGHATLVGLIGAVGVMGLAATPTNLYAVTGAGDLLLLDVHSGAGAKKGSSGLIYWGASNAPAVPEPGALVLFGSGLLMIAKRFQAVHLPEMGKKPAGI